jgi:hypothetical protein
MEYQWLFNIIIAVTGFLGGVLVNRLFGTLDKINDDLKQIPEKYVTITVKTSAKSKKCLARYLSV